MQIFLVLVSFDSGVTADLNDARHELALMGLDSFEMRFADRRFSVRIPKVRPALPLTVGARASA